MDILNYMYLVLSPSAVSWTLLCQSSWHTALLHWSSSIRHRSVKAPKEQVAINTNCSHTSITDSFHQ